MTTIEIWRPYHHICSKKKDLGYQFVSISYFLKSLNLFETLKFKNAFWNNKGASFLSIILLCAWQRPPILPLSVNHCCQHYIQIVCILPLCVVRSHVIPPNMTLWSKIYIKICLICPFSDTMCAVSGQFDDFW